MRFLIAAVIIAATFTIAYAGDAYARYCTTTCNYIGGYQYCNTYCF